MKKFFVFVLISFLGTSVFASPSIEKISGFSLTKNSIVTIDILKAGKPTVVIFLSKDCPCSKANLDYLNTLSKQFSDFSFIGIHAKKGSLTSEIANYLQDKKLNFDVFNDSDLKISDEFKALKTPHVFIVSPKGEILYNGGVTNTTSPTNAKEHYLKTALTDIQSHRPVSYPQTRTLGCFITR